MSTRARPLSPHLQIYRLPLVAIMSITHRISGVALAVGSLMLAIWLGAAAYGPAPFNAVSWFLGSWLGLLLLFGWSAALYYHLCNGIRHLFWDVGIGFELKQAHVSNKMVLVATAVLTLATWLIVAAL
jgi:succinate dehydrogenase / fumarate reductase cytochrome b subunit